MTTLTEIAAETARVSYFGQTFEVREWDFQTIRVNDLDSLAQDLKSRGKMKLAAKASAKALYIQATIAFLEAAEADDRAAALDHLSLAIMALRPDLAASSNLFHWLELNSRDLTRQERRAVCAILDLFEADPEERRAVNTILLELA